MHPSPYKQKIVDALTELIGDQLQNLDIPHTITKPTQLSWMVRAKSEPEGTGFFYFEIKLSERY